MNTTSDLSTVWANIPAQPNTNKEISINEVENGYIIRVGCKTFVTEDLSKAFDGIALYFKSPDLAVRKYLKAKTS